MSVWATDSAPTRSAEKRKDERVRYNRLKSGYLGLLMLIGVLALFRGAVEIWDLPVRAVVQSCIFFGVVFAIGVFLYLERRA